MADTPESEVFLKREGTGSAQILGGPTNVLGELHNLQANRARREQVAVEYAKQEKAARDKRMMELLEREPEATFEPFNQEVLGAVAAHRKSVNDYMDKGGNVNSSQFNTWNANKWNQLNDMARRGNWIKDEITKTRDLIKADPNLDTKYYNDKINDLYMDATGKGVPLEKVDVNKIREVTDDPGGFNMLRYTKDFTKNMEDNVFNFHDKQLRGYGLDTKDTKVKIKADLYTPDPSTKSGVVEDADGNPVINANKDFVAAFTTNPMANRWLDKKAAEQGIDKKQLIEQLVKPNGLFNKEEKETSHFFPGNFSLGGGYNNKDEIKVTKRLQNISSLAHAFTDDEGFVSDKPTPAAERMLSYLKSNTTMDGGNIVDAKLEKGDDEKGTPDRISFKVKHGTKGLPKDYSVDLSDPNEATAQLNSIFEGSKSEGGFHVGHDVLRNLDETKFNGQYLNRERKIRPDSYDEKRMISQVQKWSQGEELSKLTGKMYGDQKIVSAAHRSPFFGDDTVTLTLADGSKQTLKANDSEDLKKLKGIYINKGTGAAVKLAGEKGGEVLNNDFWNKP